MLESSAPLTNSAVFLTKLTVRNFKRFGEVEIELGNPVVFVGPNNSGKTTALQALTLWDIGLRRWNEKRQGKTTPEKRPGVTINRRDLIAAPVPNASLLWRDLRVRLKAGRNSTQNIRVDIIVEGVTQGNHWRCGLEFDYANEESFYCRPLRTVADGSSRMSVPKEVSDIQVAFLPPMSGLAAEEPRVDRGRINVLVGEGRTAEVLRNLCYQIIESRDGEAKWEQLKDRMYALFGVSLNQPEYITERGEIRMSYQEARLELDLSSSGRGLQQTLILLAFLMLNRNSVLLLDEPDAHLEILRQRQIYDILTRTARQQGSQIIAASHSEVILNEAADRDVVIAFLGKPHRIDDRGSQLLKSLKEIGFEHYYQAEQAGWVLYLEGATDLEMLRAFARVLKHPLHEQLERLFVHYVGNQPQKARDHFYGLREAKPDLVGFALYDRLDHPLPAGILFEHAWQKREFENYLCSEKTLLAWAEAEGTRQTGGPLFAEEWQRIMNKSITQVAQAMATLGKGSPWSPDTKVSDDFLTPLFENFYKTLKLPNLMRKTDFHVLADHVPQEDVDTEVANVLAEILQVASQASPRGGENQAT
ncbi:ATP-binding protein [soil metagenome]